MCVPSRQAHSHTHPLVFTRIQKLPSQGQGENREGNAKHSRPFGVSQTQNAASRGSPCGLPVLRLRQQT